MRVFQPAAQLRAQAGFRLAAVPPPAELQHRRHVRLVRHVPGGPAFQQQPHPLGVARGLRQAVPAARLQFGQEGIGFQGEVDFLPLQEFLPDAAGGHQHLQAGFHGAGFVPEFGAPPTGAQQAPHAEPGPRGPVGVGQYARQFDVEGAFGDAGAGVVHVTPAVGHGQAEQHVGPHAVVEAEVAAVHVPVHREAVLGLAVEAAGRPPAPQRPVRSARRRVPPAQRRVEPAPGQHLRGRHAPEADRPAPAPRVRPHARAGRMGAVESELGEAVVPGQAGHVRRTAPRFAERRTRRAPPHVARPAPGLAVRGMRRVPRRGGHRAGQRAPRRPVRSPQRADAARPGHPDFQPQRPRHAVRGARGVAPTPGVRRVAQGQFLSAQDRAGLRGRPLEACADHVDRVRGQGPADAGQHHAQAPLPRRGRVVVRNGAGRLGSRQASGRRGRQRRAHRERFRGFHLPVIQRGHDQRRLRLPDRDRQRAGGLRPVVLVRRRAAGRSRRPRQRQRLDRGARQLHREPDRVAFRRGGVFQRHLQRRGEDGEREPQRRVRHVAVHVRRGQRVHGFRHGFGRHAADHATVCVEAEPGREVRGQRILELRVAAPGSGERGRAHGSHRQVQRSHRDAIERGHRVRGDLYEEAQRRVRLVSVLVGRGQRVRRLGPRFGRGAGDDAAVGRRVVGRGVRQPGRQRRGQRVGQRPVSPDRPRQHPLRGGDVLDVVTPHAVLTSNSGVGRRAVEDRPEVRPDGDGERQRSGVAVDVGRGQRIGRLVLQVGRRAGQGAGRGVEAEPGRQRRFRGQRVPQPSVASAGRGQRHRLDLVVRPIPLRRKGVRIEERILVRRQRYAGGYGGQIPYDLEGEAQGVNLHLVHDAGGEVRNGVAGRVDGDVMVLGWGEARRTILVPGPPIDP